MKEKRIVRTYCAVLLVFLLLLSVCCSGCVAIRNEWEEHFGKDETSSVAPFVYENFSEQMTVVLEYYHGKENELLTTEEYLLSKEDTQLLLDALKPNEIEFKVGNVLKMIMEKAYNVYLNEKHSIEINGILDGSNADGHVRRSEKNYSGGGYIDTSVVELLEEIVDRSELVKSVVLDIRTGERTQNFPKAES